ncbi:MAG: HEAT repeat domain-containing protein [Polyangiaceae bacterium]|nr:HEAT repeat domain-containing protein [Polyangiaceae bacterium]NUQ77438.1 HEAT repeat domain-containing protein [Polyangiaceae bacterium]
MDRRGRAEPRRGFVFIAIAWLFALFFGARPLAAHVIPNSATLGQLTRAASVAAVAKITAPHAMVELGDAKIRRFVVEAEIIEVLRGDIPKGPVRFVPHGHGAEAYEAGEETFIFLQPIEQNRELAGSKLASAVRFAGIDEVADRITLRPSNRGVYLEAARAYASIAAEPSETRGDALRRITLSLLTSSEPRLASFALKDLVLAGADPSADPKVTADDLPALLAVLEDPSRALSLRVGLLGELERRKLVEGAPRWVKLLKESPAAELSTVARIAGRRAYPEVTAELVRWMEGTDPQAATAAAAALGAPGNEAAVDPLGRAVWGSDAKLRWAAIQSLGRIASEPARAVLKRAASEHPDAETRRAAQTEINLLAARRAAPSESGDAATKEPITPKEPSQGGSLVRAHWKTFALLGGILIAAAGVFVFIRRRFQRGGAPR